MVVVKRLFLLAGLFIGGLANVQAQTPLVMDMTGTPALGEDVTIAFKDGVTPVGTYFDIWICGEDAQVIDQRPDDNNPPELNKHCTPLNFWFRTGDPAVTAITFTMTDDGYDPGEGEFANVPVRDPETGDVIAEGEGGIPGADYCALIEPIFDEEGSRIEPPYYLITHDYEGGDHSNWFGPMSCPQVSSIPTNSIWGLFVLMAMMFVAGVMIIRGRVA